MFAVTSTYTRLKNTVSSHFTSRDDDDAVDPRLPVELLDHVIDELREVADQRNISLVCRRAMIRCRRRFFSTLTFSRDDRSFDKFLNLLERSSWTSFAAVESIYFVDLFRGPRWHTYRARMDTNRIIRHLPNLKSIWLSSTRTWQISWTSIPSYVRQLITGLDLHDLQIDSLLFHRKDWAEFFMTVRKPVILTLYNLEFGMMDDLSYLSAIFRRSLKFGSLDSSSILPLEAIWDYSIANGLCITVDTFHLRLLELPPWNRDHYVTFLSQKFLRHVGPSIHCLLFNLSGTYSSPVALHCYDSVDLSRCINLRILRFGCFSLDIEEIYSKMDLIWKLLSALPFPTGVEEISIAVGPKDEFKDTRLRDLEAFPWLEMVERLKSTLSNLKKIVIGVGTYGTSPALPLYLEKLREVGGLRECENAGLVKLSLIHWTSPAWDELPWRQVTGIE